VTVVVYPDARALAVAVSRRVSGAIRRQPRLVLGLPTGRTPLPLYDELAIRAGRGTVDFSRVTTFNLDEFVGLTPDHPASYRAFMERHLFVRVGLPPGRAHVPDGSASDLDRECARYERAVRRAGGIDLLVLGLGLNGHIGFNEPGPALAAWTHRVRLSPQTRRANRGLFGGRPGLVPREGLTMGVATILQARRILLMATGRAKAPVVRRLLRGPVTTWLPASFLHLHGRVEVLLDRAAARQLV